MPALNSPPSDCRNAASVRAESMLYNADTLLTVSSPKLQELCLAHITCRWCAEGGRVQLY
jgi:hypothetical protein